MARLLVLMALALALVAGCTSSDTRDGPIGDTRDGPIGDTPLYSTCGSIGDCDGAADDCFTVAWEVGRDGTMCSLYCSEHEDCPGNSSCYELVGDPSMERVCFERCENDLDCPTTHQCVNAEMGGGIVDAICLPT